MHQLILHTSAAGVSKVCKSSFIFHINQNKLEQPSIPTACQLLYALNSSKCSTRGSSRSRIQRCFQHGDKQFSETASGTIRLRNCPRISMLPCKGVISKYLIYAQLLSHDTEQFAFRTKLSDPPKNRHVMQGPQHILTTRAYLLNKHRSAKLELEMGKRKEGCPASCHLRKSFHE